jgi:photosystem I subunit 12
MFHLVTIYFPSSLLWGKLGGEYFIVSQGVTLTMSDTQVLVALVIALIPGILAFRLSTELYK